MPFYPRLPDPHYIDPLSTGIRGLSAGLQVGNQALQSQMYGEALAQEREQRQALKEYGQTGDIGKLMSVAPEVGLKMQEAQARQQKALMDAVKPGLELTYMLAPTATEENYGALRSSIIKSFPVMEGVLPPNYSKPQIDSFIGQYENFLRKGKETTPNYVYDQATDTWKQAPGPGKVSVLRPYETPAEKEQRHINVATAKEDLRRDRPAKGKDYTAKLADLDIKETSEARKIANSFDKKIAGLTGSKETIRRETDRLLKERDAALADNKKTFAGARAKLGGPAAPRKALKDMSTEELRAAIARMKGQPAPAAAPAGGGSDEEDDDEE